MEGELRHLERDRNGYQQRRAGEDGGIKDGLAGDDGGHLIAAIFDGPGEQINYAAMDGRLNKGAWHSMEREWAKALKAKPPKTVKVQINAIYQGESKRPDKFEVRYWIDGDAVVQKFKNKGMD